MTFQRQCQLRADAYCRAFGLDRVTMPADRDQAIETLKTVASICQPTPEAMTAVADAEEQWAIDWLMDPRPEPPQGVDCCIDLKFIFGQESIKRRLIANTFTIVGWPMRWYLPSGRATAQRECLAHGCLANRSKDDDFCPGCLRRLRHILCPVSGLSARESRAVAEFVLKRPGNDHDLVLHVTGNSRSTKAPILSTAYAHMRARLGR